MNDEQAFLDAILAHPADADARLVYADWLDDRADPRAEYVRLSVKLATLPADSGDSQTIRERLGMLRTGLSATWLAVLDRTAVEGCFEFRRECPKRWESLQPTDEPQVRYCSACNENVFYCPTVEAAARHAHYGHCVAIDSSLVRYKNDVNFHRSHRPPPGFMVLGTPPTPPPRFQIGDPVLITAGPFEGMTGVIERLSLLELVAEVRLNGPHESSERIEFRFEYLDRARRRWLPAERESGGV